MKKHIFGKLLGLLLFGFLFVLNSSTTWAGDTEIVYDKDDEGLLEILPLIDRHQDAVDYVRQQMVERKNTIQFLVPRYASYVDASNVHSDACVHTEECSGQEGDVLKSAWNRAGFTSAMYQEYYTLLTFNITYDTTKEQEEQLTAALKAAYREMNLASKSDYEKIKTIYTYICDHVDYDYSYRGDSAYHGLCEGKTTCNGYTQLFYRMCKDNGIPVRTVSGTTYTGALHGWNIVKLDGKYYCVDATWDGQDKETTYGYFMKSEDDFPGHRAGGTRYTLEFLNTYEMAKESYVEPGTVKTPLNRENPLTYLYTLKDEIVTNEASGKPKVLIYYINKNCIRPMLADICNDTYPELDIMTICYTGDDKRMPQALAENKNKDIVHCYTPTGGYGNGLSNYTDVVDEGSGIYVVFVDANNKLQKIVTGNCSPGLIRRCAKEYLNVSYPDEPVKADGISISCVFDETVAWNSACGGALCREDALKVHLGPANVAVKKVKYTSSDPSVVTIDQEGNMRAMNPGTVTITVSTIDGSNLSASHTFRVNKPIYYVSLLRIKEEEVFLDVGETYQLNMDVLPLDAEDRSINWKISEPSKIEISQEGVIKTLDYGTAYVTASPNTPGAGPTMTKDRFYVRVFQKTKSVGFGTDKRYVDIGTQNSLSPNVTPKKAYKNFTWTSSDPSVATVDNNGITQGLKRGQTIITATTKDGTNLSASYILVVDGGNSDGSDNSDTSDDTSVELPSDWPEISYQGDMFAYHDNCIFARDGQDVRCYRTTDGSLVINEFKCDGTYTYYFQADGTAMRDRLTYHPNGIHVIYFDEDGHEVFSNFANVKKTIAGETVDDYCFFDVYGYLYVDVITYDQTGTYLYYANPYGVMERNKWFEFSDTVKWADGTTFDKAGGKYGYACDDGTLMTNTWTYDWEGRYCYMQGNGVALY